MTYKIARIVKMKNVDLAKQGNKNKNLCENKNSLASKLPQSANGTKSLVLSKKVLDDSHTHPNTPEVIQVQHVES